jgi:hypothetical protein
MAVPRGVLNVAAATFLLAMAGYSAASIYYSNLSTCGFRLQPEGCVRCSKPD